jgi:hypothetical protein
MMQTIRVYLSSLDFHACQLDARRMVADFCEPWNVHSHWGKSDNLHQIERFGLTLTVPVYFLEDLLQYTCVPVNYVFVVCLFDFTELSIACHASRS